jgi:hypothetical protein
MSGNNDRVLLIRYTRNSYFYFFSQREKVRLMEKQAIGTHAAVAIYTSAGRPRPQIPRLR